MGLNKQQAAIATTFDTSINVCAGAGTGKTFTLTQRTVNAVRALLAQSSESDCVEVMDRIMAITFTTKAAAELRSRIRSALLAVSVEEDDPAFLQSAVAVESAWISTIHGMASRILKENALDFGIDPDLEIIDSAQTDRLINQAIEEVLFDYERSGASNALVSELFEVMNVQGFNPNERSIKSCLQSIFSHIASMPTGLSGLFSPAPSASPNELLSMLYRAGIEVLPAFDAEDMSDSAQIKAQEYKSSLEGALDGALKWMEEHKDTSFMSADFNSAYYLEVFFAFPPTTEKFGKGSEVFELLDEYRIRYQTLAREVAASVGARHGQAIVLLASEVKRRMDQMKCGARTIFDNADLLIRCNEELGRPENAALVKRYQEELEHIMLDEFQDTDQLQMEIINKISRTKIDQNSREVPLANVCTVGDMQQSIYRFRGGDVSETLKRIAALSNGAGQQFALTGNYRTHADILDSVECVFKRVNAFGDNFLKLEACCETLDDALEPYFAGESRVTYDFIHKGSKKGIPALNIDELRACAALRIAQHFRKLADAGQSPRRMALLLGGMTASDIYADALRSVGLGAMVAGGSVFTKTEEAQLISLALKYAINTDDEEVLLKLLLTPLFNVTDDVLLALTTMHDEEGFHRVGLSRGFRHWEEAQALTDEEYRMLESSADTLKQFVDEAHTKGASCALRALLVESGLLYRLEMDEESMPGLPDSVAQRRAFAANLAKAVRIVEDLEADAVGLADLSRAYDDVLAFGKEAPGILFMEDDDYVQIMTVHASKGLEFDHVAVAELGNGITGAESFVVENVDDKTLLAMRASKREVKNNACSKNMESILGFSLLKEESAKPSKTDFAQLKEPAEVLSFLQGYQQKEELEEAQRLLYVAMTRARESLYVSRIEKFDVAGKSTYKGTSALILDALLDTFSLSLEELPEEFFLKNGPVAFIRSNMVDDENHEEAIKQARNLICDTDHVTDEQLVKFAVPIRPPAPAFEDMSVANSHDGVYSYTSLSALTPVVHKPAARDTHDDVREKVKSSSEEDATALGTAFHHLAQASILRACAEEASELPMPSMEQIDSQVSLCALSSQQQHRLVAAVESWFTSDIAHQFASHDHMRAEVPFSVTVPCGSGSFLLEGEIDGLAFDEDHSCAYLIDYKTGGHDGESLEELTQKHALQASCYGYALLRSGFDRVEAQFIRVEHPQRDRDGALQTVCYDFSQNDEDMLAKQIGALLEEASVDKQEDAHE